MFIGKNKMLYIEIMSNPHYLKLFAIEAYQESLYFCIEEDDCIISSIEKRPLTPEYLREQLVLEMNHPTLKGEVSFEQIL